MSDCTRAADIRRLRRLVSETDIEKSDYTDKTLGEYLDRNEGVIYWAAEPQRINVLDYRTEWDA